MALDSKELISSGSAEGNIFSRQVEIILISQPQAGLLEGILLGTKSNLPYQFKQALTNTSTIHIVVASGQNLTLLAGFVLGISFWVGRRKTALLAVILASFYAYMTGLQIPILRALILFGFGSLAQIIGREANGLYSISLVGLIMLIFEPRWLYSVSFQLSFLATLAVIELSPLIDQKISWMPDIIRQDLAVSLSAQLLVTPVIIANFNQLSLIGLLTNCLVLWTVPLVMITGGVALLASFINLELGQLLALIPWALLTYFAEIINFTNHLGRPLYVKFSSELMIVSYYLCLLAFYLALKRSKHDMIKQ